MEKGRIPYLDSIKGICILFVVFCHYPILPSKTFLGTLFMMLCWCGVPCFMMVTGGLVICGKSFSWKKWKKKCIMLYIILCVWKLVYLAVLLPINGGEYSLINIFKYIFLFGDLESIDTGFTWYMSTLLTIWFIYPIIHYLFNSGKRGQMLVILLGLLSFFQGFLIKFLNMSLAEIYHKNQVDGFQNLINLFPFNTSTIFPCMLVYFCLGAFFLQYKKKIQDFINKTKYHRIIPTCILIFGLGGLLFVKYKTTGSFFWNGANISFGYNLISTLITAIGFYLMVLNSNSLLIEYIGKTIGKYTMGIYYIHVLILNIISHYINTNMIDNYSILFNCLKTLIVVALCLIITKLLFKIPILKYLVK